MSVYENSLYSYVEGRLTPLERAGRAYFFRSNSFKGRIVRYDGSSGFVSNAKRGMPDVVACLGRFVGFELKAPRGRQTPEQKAAQAAIEDAGGRYYVIKSPEDFEAALKELL